MKPGFVSYVISPIENKANLNHFLHQENAASFQVVEVLPENTALSIGLESLFDLAKFEQKYGYKPLVKDICRTVSHFQTWNLIANNPYLADHDYALVADLSLGQLVLSDKWQAVLDQHLTSFHKNNKYDLIFLQRNEQENWQQSLYQGEGELSSIVYNNPVAYSHACCQFYAIRKSLAKQLITQQSQTKPYWKAHDFSEIYSFEAMAEIRPLIAYNKKQVQQLRMKQALPMFSIIVPVYNVENYLAQAIDSVLAQDFDNYELILVDDGSMDSSPEICWNYARNYPQIHFVTRANAGVSASRNLAIKMARGEYLICLDSDDYWRGTQILSSLEQHIQQNNYPDVVVHSAISLYPDGGEGRMPVYTDQFEATYVFAQDFYHLAEHNIWLGYPWSKIIKRSLVVNNQLFYPEGLHYEDFYWSVDIARYLNTYSYFDLGFYIYRREREGSITRYVSVKNMQDMFFIAKKTFKNIQQLDKQEGQLYQGSIKMLVLFCNYIVECYHLLRAENQQQLSVEFQALQDLQKLIKEK